MGNCDYPRVIGLEQTLRTYMLEPLTWMSPFLFHFQPQSCGSEHYREVFPIDSIEWTFGDPSCDFRVIVLSVLLYLLPRGASHAPLF